MGLSSGQVEGLLGLSLMVRLRVCQEAFCWSFGDPVSVLCAASKENVPKTFAPSQVLDLPGVYVMVRVEVSWESLCW